MAYEQAPERPTPPDTGHLAQALCLIDCAKNGWHACTWDRNECQDFCADHYQNTAEHMLRTWKDGVRV